MAQAATKTTQHDLSTEVFEDRRTIPNGGDFTLDSSKGKISLSQYKDKVVILLFGYLSCPDICPTAMKKIGTALKRIAMQEQEEVQVFFITLDPERDDIEHLDQFSAFFDKNIIALTGKSEEIRHVADLYGVTYSKVPSKTGSGYLINHSVASYILSPDNVIRYILSYDATPGDIVDVIHTLFKKSYQ